MSSKPINPITFSVDIEANNLPTDFHIVRGLGEPFRLPDLSKMVDGFANVDIYQIGYMANGEKKHVDVTETTFKHPEVSTPLKYSEEYIDAAGKTRSFKRATTVTASRESYESLFKSSVNKMNAASTEQYRKKVLPYYLLQARKNTQFMLDNGGSIGAMPFDVFIKPYEEIRRIAESPENGFKYSQVTQANFRGKGTDSLYEAIDNLVSSASSKDAPAVFRSWNPAYDAPVILAALQKSGHTALADKFIAQHKSGLLKIQGIEDEWHEVLWKLTKENPDIADDIRVGMHPIAAIATGRPGGKVTTYGEFKYSTYSWKQEDIAKLFRGHKNFRDIGHIASTDILQSEELASFMQAVKERARKTLGLKEATEALNLEDTGNAFTDAFNAEIAKTFGDNGATTARGMLREATIDSKRKNKFFRQNFGSWFAADTSKRARASWTKYPGVIGAAIAVAGATYLANSETKTSLGSGFSSINGVPIGKGIGSGIDKDSPNLGANMVGAMASGIVVPGITMAAIGYGAAQRHPMLGYSPSKPETFTQAWNQIKSTIRYGIKTTEGQVSLARVFELGSLTDYFSSSRTYLAGKGKSGNLPNGKPGRYYKFNVIQTKNGITRVLDQKSPGHGMDMTKFMHVLKRDNISQYKKLDSILNPNIKDMAPEKRPYTRQIRIASTVGGGTRVQWDDYATESFGKENRITNYLLIDKHIGINKLRDVIPQAANLHTRQTDKNNLRSTNTAAREAVHRDMYRYGGFAKDEYEDYMGRLVKPGFARRSELGNTAWRGAEKLRWMLDLNSKSVGEANNLLIPNVAETLNSTKAVVLVKDARYYADVIPNWLIGSMDRFLETPFEFLGVEHGKIEGLANKLKASPNFTTNTFGKALSAIEKPHFGLGLAANGGSASRYLMSFGLKRVLPAYLAINMFSLTDHLLGAATMSPTGRGPLTSVPIKAYETASLLYTKMSDIVGLTDYAKWQADVAPGSTGIGIFAPAATMTATYFMGEVAYKHGPDFIGGAIDKAAKKAIEHPFLQKALRKESFTGAVSRGPVERFMSYAIKNPKKALFGLAMLPAIPFVPGFLGSDKNYMEKKAEYDGEKDVAIRKYRGWLLSSSPFEGGRVRSFRRHALNLVESDFENRGVVYPSFAERFAHSATLGLYKPNMLEEYHKESQPVYKSAPFGANIPLLGPLIAGTLGQIIGQKTYHVPGETAGEGDGVGYDMGIGLEQSLSDGESRAMIAGDGSTGYIMGLEDPASLNSMASRFADTLSDLSGFRGFTTKTLYSRGSGKSLPDDYTPYAQDASQMYSPAEQMWQYNLGDITVVGGEFLRRVLQNSEKKWQVNDIPNELMGVSWIPQSDNYGKDLTHGTTFDKVDMGWLYGARKGWEFLYPGEANGEMETYGAPVRTEILSHIAPYSRQYKQEAKKTLDMALDDRIDPRREQRFYETLEQVSQVKEQLYATAGEYTHTIDTESRSGVVQSMDESTGSFMINNTQYRLAGVSTNEADIRSRLLQKKEFENARQLSAEVQRVQLQTAEIMRSNLAPGTHIDMDVATAAMLPSATNLGYEARISGLSEKMLEAGAAFADTGNIATHNMAQDRHGMFSKLLASHWEGMTSVNSYWNKKLISQRDYLDNYTTNQVFNREVKLWTRPIDHILKPFIASTMHNWFGLDAIPSFTKQRRATQQYWDILKYIKYKTLSTKSRADGDLDSATYYETQWRSTMVGADPTNESKRDELMALPGNERQYFNYFSAESDPDKRSEIFKYLPEPAKRIYSSIWLKKMAETSSNQEVQAAWAGLKSSEGWSLSEEEEADYINETNGNVSKGDWARARFVQQYARENDLPGPEWSGWNSNVDIDNTQLLSLMEDGENAQDYGFFDSKIRKALYDDDAYKAATDIDSASTTASVLMGSALPYLMEDSMSLSYAVPVSMSSPTIEMNIETNGFNKILMRMNDLGSSLLPDEFLD